VLTCKYSNQTSLQAINEVFDSTKTAEKKNVISDVEEIDDPMAQTSNDASEERNDAEHLKKRLRTLLGMFHCTICCPLSTL